MDEVATTEGTSHKGRASSSGTLDVAGVSDVTEDLSVTETAQGQLDPVGVGGEVLDGVKEATEKTVSVV